MVLCKETDPSAPKNKMEAYLTKKWPTDVFNILVSSMAFIDLSGNLTTYSSATW